MGGARLRRTCDVLRLLGGRGGRRRHVTSDNNRLQRQRHAPHVALYGELDGGCGWPGDDALAQLQRLLHHVHVVYFDDGIPGEKLQGVTLFQWGKKDVTLPLLIAGPDGVSDLQPSVTYSKTGTEKQLRGAT